jgi:hypothetical protein
MTAETQMHHFDAALATGLCPLDAEGTYPCAGAYASDGVSRRRREQPRERHPGNTSRRNAVGRLFTEAEKCHFWLAREQAFRGV